MADFPQGAASSDKECPTFTNRFQQLLEEAGEQAAQRARDHATSIEDRIGDCCESPIEALFALAMCMQEECGAFEVGHVFHWASHMEREKCVNIAKAECDDFSFYTHGPIDRIFVFSQTKIDNFRVDFLIIGMRDDFIVRKSGGIINGAANGKEIVEIVVECDGHQYHERSKAQASRDKSRDRALQALGLPVFRFTGSEIHKDPLKCASEVHRYIRKQWNPRWSGRGHG